MAKTAVQHDNEAEYALSSVDPVANLPASLDDYSGYEGFDSSDLIIPRVKIVQPTSRKGTPGKFSMNLTDEEFSEMAIVVMKVNRSRVLWSKDMESEDPLCRSVDFFVPDPSITHPYSDVCAQYVQKGNLKVLETICDQGKWVNNERPACNQVYNLLSLSAENVPFWMSLSGASISPVKRFISSIALQRKKLWQFETTITTEERTKPNRYYAIRFSAPKLIDPERLSSIAELVVALKDQVTQPPQDLEASAIVDEAPF